MSTYVVLGGGAILKALEFIVLASFFILIIDFTLLIIYYVAGFVKIKRIHEIMDMSA